MANKLASKNVIKTVDYPTSDGRPMAETDLHRGVMVDTIDALEYRYADRPMVYVSGNNLIFYVPGDKRRHVSPDTYVVFGVEKKRRDYYLLWEEGKSPNVAIEITSKSTRREDMKKKWELYRDVLQIKEYFLFDPTSDYLRPRLQGFRLVDGDYVPIVMNQGRLESKELGLFLEADGNNLRFFDPKAQQWIPTTSERLATAQRSVESEKRRADQLAAELERMRQEMKQRGQEKPKL